MFLVMRLIDDHDDGSYFKTVGSTVPREFVQFSEASDYALSMARHNPRDQYTIFQAVAHCTATQHVEVNLSFAPRAAIKAATHG